MNLAISKALSRKEERFVREYLLDENPTRAAIRAGYSIERAAVIGQELATDPRIAPLIEAVRRKRQMPDEITADLVASMILAVYLSAMQTRQCSAAIRACELLSRYTGGFTGDKPSEKNDLSEQREMHRRSIENNLEVIIKAAEERGFCFRVIPSEEQSSIVATRLRNSHVPDIGHFEKVAPGKD